MLPVFGIRCQQRDEPDLGSLLGLRDAVHQVIHVARRDHVPELRSVCRTERLSDCLRGQRLLSGSPVIYVTISGTDQEHLVSSMRQHVVANKPTSKLRRAIPPAARRAICEIARKCLDRGDLCGETGSFAQPECRAVSYA